jgi:hypothetical protein
MPAAVRSVTGPGGRQEPADRPDKRDAIKPISVGQGSQYVWCRPVSRRRQ